MSAQSVGCVLCVHKNEASNTTTNTSNCCNSFTRTYRKYTTYIPWPTPCEVAEEMLTMVSCEHHGSRSLEAGQHLIGQSIVSSKNERLKKTITAQSMFGASGP